MINALAFKPAHCKIEHRADKLSAGPQPIFNFQSSILNFFAVLQVPKVI